jgi:hypothetical protein
MDHLETFCTTRLAKHRDDILLGLPWVQDGRVYFRVKDFRKALKRDGCNATSHLLWSIVEKNGGQQEFIHAQNKTVRTWSVPDFTRQEGGFELPAVPAGDF